MLNAGMMFVTKISVATPSEQFSIWLEILGDHSGAAATSSLVSRDALSLANI